MPKKKIEAAMDFSFPSPEERKAAMSVCCGSHCPGCESPDDYAWRRRDVDLSLLADEVIEKRLTPKEREVMTAYWFGGKTLSAIASEFGVCTSSVSRCLEKAQKKLYDALSCAVAYQHNIENIDFLPIAVRRALAVSAAKRFEPKNIGERIRKLRCSQNIGEQLLSEATGIPIKCLRAIEESGEMPTLSQIVLLAGFFETTTDYLLKGEGE